VEVTGQEFHVEVDPESKDRHPFRALLDVGLRRTTTGARLFGALKGACDGGLDIPHNDRRFPGSKAGGEGEDDIKANPEVHKKYIFGGHVAEYMTKLKDDEEAYNKQFGAYVKLGVEADALAGLYKAAHAAIREEPNRARPETLLGRFHIREGAKPEPTKKHWNQRKISKKQRAGRVRQKLAKLLK